MIPLDVEAARIRARDDGCFGCGGANPAGLHLDGFGRMDDAIVARFAPRPEHRGFSGMLHGGVVAAALDEIMAWTAMLAERVSVVTGTLRIRYRAPAPATGVYLLSGRLVERRGRRLTLTATMLLGPDTVAAAEGLFLVRDPLDHLALGGRTDAG